MESVELPMTTIETAVGEDFSVDDLLDFSNDDVFVEDGAELKIQRDNGELSVSSNDEITLNRSKDFSTACELAVPTDDLAELEWLSNFVDSSSFTPYSAPSKKPVWLTGARRHPILTPVNVESCLKPPLPVKIRTKRPRTGVNLWSPSLTDSSSSSATSSSSSSSSSGHSSPLLLSGAEFLDEKAVKRQKKKKKRLSSLEAQTQTRRCSHCGVQKTPQWRAGPSGAKTLCNACGVRFKSGRLLPEYRPACSPTFSSELHSNHHRKVVEMRQKKGVSGDAEQTGMNQPAQAVQSF